MGQLVSVLTALAAVGAIGISWLSLDATRDGQATSRYTSAVDQLGSDEMVTRIGGAYALGRLAAESEYDRPVITDLLVDFVRSKIGPAVIDPADCDEADEPPEDVVAVLRVLVYTLTGELRGRRLNLERVCLAGVELPGADLSCARLDEAVTDGAVLTGATFADARLQAANLRNTNLDGAVLTRADATRAIFGDASDVTSATMAGADLRAANLTAATLVQVHLDGADLTGAVLTRTDLAGSRLRGATMRTYLRDLRNPPLEMDRRGELSTPPAFGQWRCPERRAGEDPGKPPPAARGPR